MIYTYPQLLKEIYVNGHEIITRNLTSRELINVQMEAQNETLFFCEKVRSFNHVKRYLIGELIWYMSGLRSIWYIKQYSKFWEKLADGFDQVNSNYGYLVYYKKKEITQFNWCVLSLTKDVNSRQAIIIYNHQGGYYEGNKDFICTQTQHFLIRNNELISIVYIRSSDAILGLTYDIPWWSLVQQHLFLILKDIYPSLKLGKLFVHLGSVHIYQDKYQLVGEMLDNTIESRYVRLLKPIPLSMTIEWLEQNIHNYIQIL